MRPHLLKTSFDELSKKEQLMLCHLLFDQIFSNTINLEYATKIAAFKILSDANYDEYKNITALEWADLIMHVNWITESKIITKQHFPKIRVGLRWYYGPVGLMETSSAMEFITCDTDFIEAAKSGKAEYLYRLAAVLYRPAHPLNFLRRFSSKWDDDKRAPLNRSSILRRAKRFEKKLSKAHLTYITLYYRSFREIELMRFRDLFSRSKSSSKNVGGWFGVLLEFSGNKFGDYSTTSKINWKLFCLEMLRQLQIQKEAAEKQKSNK
jgi:hypothetical protein